MADRADISETGRSRVLRVWLADPISYSGMAYTDASQVASLRSRGIDAVLYGSDDWMLGSLAPVPRVAIFKGTSGRRNRLLRGMAYLRSLLRFVGLVHRERPDIVHWQYLELPIADAAAMHILRMFGTRQVLTVHELLPWSAKAYHRRLFRRVYAVMDRVVAHRAEQREALVDQFGIPRSRVAVADLGDFEGFAAPELPQSNARASLRLDAGTPVALFFGALRPSKGLDVLLQAWPTVTAVLPEAMLLIAGKPFKGAGVDWIAATTQAQGQSANVRTDLRQVAPAEANDYYRAADVVVLPYLEIGTSGVIRYAYSSARPVVATAVGDHPLHVVPGVTGELVPPADASALANALIGMLGDRQRAANLGLHALEYTRRHFSWNEIAVALESVYEEALRERR